MAIYPGLTLSEEEIDTIVDYTTRIGNELQVKGLMNIQYVVVGGPAYRSPRSTTATNTKTEVYIIEVNPRASRTIPFISKVTGVPMIRLAIKAMLGKKLKDEGYEGGLWKKQNLVAVKAPVFSMAKLTGVDTYLGPEMKSTGEVMGIDKTFPAAAAKALMASGLMLPEKGSILLSISDRSKAEAVPMIRQLAESGYKLYATSGTADMIRGLGIEVTQIAKNYDPEHPNTVDLIVDGTINAVVNTIEGHRASMEDGFDIRRAAVDFRIPCYTSMDTARIAVECLSSGGAQYNIRPLSAYRGEQTEE